jgi:hypothetical protein
MYNIIKVNYTLTSLKKNFPHSYYLLIVRNLFSIFVKIIS